MTTKVKYRSRGLPHTITLYRVTRDSYGKETLTSSTVQGYMELDRISTPAAGSGGPQHMNGFAIVPGNTEVAIGDYVEFSSVRRKIVDINEIRVFRNTVWRKELEF